jgi:hypothetical protein
MTLDEGLEKAMDPESGTATTNSTAYHLDIEKTESGIPAQGALGEPDENHETVEALDQGHLEDLELQHVRHLYSTSISTDHIRLGNLSKQVPVNPSTRIVLNALQANRAPRASYLG